MRTGGLSFAGGTCRAGGSIDAEQRYYEKLQDILGEGAYNKDEGRNRSRVLMTFARMLADIENEAIKGARESMPCLAIDQLDEWEKIFDVALIEGVLKTVKRQQDFMRALMGITLTMASIGRVVTEVIRLVDEEKVYGFENTGSTMISPDGVRYACVLVPWDEGPYPGRWLQDDEHRPLWRVIERMLRRWAPAHVELVLCTSDDGGAPNRPAFYTDGYKDCACGKDCVGI